jgi:catechol 2,3-dioxygenase-like lactoylglutathione lyase family enzyme
MIFKLHHFGIVCKDLEKSIICYRDQLGNQLTSRWYNKGFFDIAFIGSGGEATIELVGKPFTDYEQVHIPKHGYSINHISFRVDDLDAALDEDGLMFELFSYLSPLPLAAPDLSKPLAPTEMNLHHISILTPELRRSQKFYEEKLGFKTVYEYTADDGGFIFLIDPTFNHHNNNFMLEIIGPPHLEEREVMILEKRGACYDHLCYTAEDVGGAWEKAIDLGAEKMTEPFEDYGVQIAWVRDHDGNDVEIMNPIPAEIIEVVLQGGEPLNGAQM